MKRFDIDTLQSQTTEGGGKQARQVCTLYLYLVPCILYFVPCTLYFVLYTLYFVPCTSTRMTSWRDLKLAEAIIYAYDYMIMPHARDCGYDHEFIITLRSSNKYLQII